MSTFGREKHLGPLEVAKCNVQEQAGEEYEAERVWRTYIDTVVRMVWNKHLYILIGCDAVPALCLVILLTICWYTDLRVRRTITPFQRPLTMSIFRYKRGPTTIKLSYFLSQQS
jgi:hypothetical protein